MQKKAGGPVESSKATIGREVEGEQYEGGEYWTDGDPQPHPTLYQCPTADGFRMREIPFKIDWTSSDSVNKANKYRRNQVWRAMDSLRLPKLRASTQGREHTAENDMFLAMAHEEYATEHDGKKIPLQLLTDQYNARFPDEDRFKSSISSHIDRISDLKGARQQYDGADDS